MARASMRGSDVGRVASSVFAEVLHRRIDCIRFGAPQDPEPPWAAPAPACAPGFESIESVPSKVAGVARARLGLRVRGVTTDDGHSAPRGVLGRRWRPSFRTSREDCRFSDAVFHSHYYSRHPCHARCHTFTARFTGFTTTYRELCR
jgi:hypothetical protein